jgi:hypothetical protein
MHKTTHDCPRLTTHVGNTSLFDVMKRKKYNKLIIKLT